MGRRSPAGRGKAGLRRNRRRVRDRAGLLGRGAARPQAGYSGRAWPRRCPARISSPMRVHCSWPKPSRNSTRVPPQRVASVHRSPARYECRASRTSAQSSSKPPWRSRTRIDRSPSSTTRYPGRRGPHRATRRGRRSGSPRWPRTRAGTPSCASCDAGAPARAALPAIRRAGPPGAASFRERATLLPGRRACRGGRAERSPGSCRRSPPGPGAGPSPLPSRSRGRRERSRTRGCATRRGPVAPPSPPDVVLQPEDPHRVPGAFPEPSLVSVVEGAQAASVAAARRQ